MLFNTPPQKFRQSGHASGRELGLSECQREGDGLAEAKPSTCKSELKSSSLLLSKDELRGGTFANTHRIDGLDTYFMYNSHPRAPMPLEVKIVPSLLRKASMAYKSLRHEKKQNHENHSLGSFLFTYREIVTQYSSSHTHTWKHRSQNVRHPRITHHGLLRVLELLPPRYSTEAL